jgi:hypothetical protein
MKELRVYLIDCDLINEVYADLTDEQFMDYAEELGTVYSIPGFQDAFNLSGVNTNVHVIRFITIEN